MWGQGGTLLTEENSQLLSNFGSCVENICDDGSLAKIALLFASCKAVKFRL